MTILGNIVVLFDYLNSISLPQLGLCLTVAAIAAAEVGLVAGRRSAACGTDKDASGMAATSLGLLLQLIAFTYFMALARYDQRRSLVLREVNAIGSTANFAFMLPQSDQMSTLDLLRQHTQVRLDPGVPYDDEKLQRDVSQSNALVGKLWQAAVAPQSLPVYRYVASFNETNNVAEARLTALRNHVPVVILLMLAGTALIAMGLVGYAAGAGGVNRQVSLVIMSALLAFLIVVTQDLARFDRGSIEVSFQALQDALAAIPSPVGR